MPKGKPAIKEIVDRHLHGPDAPPGDLAIVVGDRLAASGTATISGADVLGVHGGLIDIRGGGRVPLHRVVEVRSKGARVWPRS